MTELNVVSAEPGEVLDKNHIDPARLCVLNQPLNAGTLEIRSRVTVVDVSVDLVPAPLPDIPLKQELLVFDADGFPVALVVVAQSAIDADIVCVLCHIFYLPACHIHTLCGDGSCRIAPAVSIIE